MRQMKDSGIEWIGEIPAEWEVRRLSTLISLESGCPIASDDILNEGLYPIFGGNGIRGYTNSYSIDGNFILIGRQGAQCGNIHYALGKIWATEHALIVKPITDINKKFLYFLLISMNLNQYSTTAAQPGLSAANIRKKYICYPPLPEQQCIADYLDAQCARIDETMELVRQSREKLRAYKLSLITEAVTRGLDPDVPMKDSGVPWIGEIPAGWEVRRLKTISNSIVVGIVINPSQYVADEGLPYIYGGDIQEGKINTTTCRKISKENSLENKKTILSCNDILTVRVGYPGISSVVPKECEGGNCASVILTRKGDFNSFWYCYCLNSQVIKSQIDIVKYGAAQEQFNLSHMIEFSVPVPPLDEQQRIAAYLDEKCARIDALLAEKDELLGKLAEYKKSLIFECVTGKREVAA